MSNQEAINLLQLWIKEVPDHQNEQDFLNFKELIDEQRPERKLFNE